MAWIPKCLPLFYYFIIFQERNFLFFVDQKVFISFIVVHQMCIFKQGWDKTCTNMKEVFDKILTVHLGKVICASLVCCVFFLMTCLPCLCLSPAWSCGLTYQFWEFPVGVSPQKDMHPKSVIVLSQRFINQTQHHV